MKGLRIFIASFVGVIVVASSGEKPIYIPDVKVYTDNDTLSIKDFKRPLIVYLGYAKCPDVCNSALFLINSAWKRSECKFRLVFVGIDPNENIKDLRDYAKKFNKTFIAVKPLSYYQLKRAFPSAWFKDGKYIQHSAFVYYYGRKVQRFFPIGGFLTDEIMEILKKDGCQTVNI